MDFVHDQMATGRNVRVLTMVDVLAVLADRDPRFSYRAEDVGAMLEATCWVWAIHGRSGWIRGRSSSPATSTCGPANNVTLDFSRPGKPTDNPFIEAFNGRFRAECLNAHWFMTLADALGKLEAWRKYYNEERPHGAIGNKVPISLQTRCDASGPLP